LAREALRLSMLLAGQAPRRWGPLSSNVRLREQPNTHRRPVGALRPRG
jgi:hypothetical protein